MRVRRIALRVAKDILSALCKEKVDYKGVGNGTVRWEDYSRECVCWDEVTRSIWVTVARNGGINSVRTKKRRWFGRGKEEGKSQEVEAQAVYYMRRRVGKCGATEKKTIQYCVDDGWDVQCGVERRLKEFDT